MIELFSGIGAQIKGTNNTGLFDTTVIATADIEKDAIVSYAAIHNGLTIEQIKSYQDYPSEEDMRNELISKNIGYDFKKNTNPITKMKGEKLKKYWLAMKLSNNLGDISKIEELPLADFWTYSFPCQDISVAGKQAGIIKGETRSGLLYEVERLLGKAKENNTLPKYLLLENVKNLVGKQFIDQFNAWIQRLDELGYNTYWKVVNAKECGIAQNRERTFAISIRKDIDTLKFEFMKPFDSGLRLRDFLEDEVDENFYLSEDKVQKFLKTLYIDNSDEGKNSPKFIGNVNRPDFGTGYAGGVWDKENISPTLTTMQGGGRQPHIMQGIDKSYNGTKQIEIANCLTAREDRGVSNRKSEGTAVLEVGRTDNHQKGGVYSSEGISPTLLATSYKQPVQIKVENIGNVNPSGKGMNGNVFDENGLAPTLTTNKGEGNKIAIRQATETGVCRIESPVKIRKLTPRECFRLMGFDDIDYVKALSVGLSNSAGYKQAGNSIVTNCIELLMEHLYKAQYDNTYICTDEKMINGVIDSDTNSIIVRGNYMPSNHDASRIVDEEGIAPTVKENHGTVTGVVRNFHQPQVD